MKKNIEKRLIKKCFVEHKKDIGEIYFTLKEYEDFWLKDNPDKIYKMVNRDKTVSKCKVVYFPMPAYKDLRALIKLENTTDYREVPVKYLE